MTGKYLKKVLAAALVLTMVSGTLPAVPVTELFGNTVITANATTGEVLNISSEDDWDNFAQEVSNGITYEGYTVNLLSDITVTTMVGDGNNRFKGTFNGNGHKLTFNYTASEDNAAPFAALEDAKVICLEVDGTIRTGYKYAAGIAAHCYGSNTIRNCISRVQIDSSIEGDGIHAGLVGVVDGGTLSVYNCLFAGSITGSTTIKCGGFVGWTATKLKVYNSLMAGSLEGINVTSDSATLSRNSVTPDNCYYRTSYGAEQGNAVGDMSNEALAENLGSSWTVVGNEVVPVIDAKNLCIATVSGINEEYGCTGEVITATPSVKTIDGTALTEGTHYTTELRLGDSVVSNMQACGIYTYTFTAVNGSGYTGDLKFSVAVKANAPIDLCYESSSLTCAALSWITPYAADAFRLQYSNDSDFPTGETTEISVNNTSAELTGLEANTVYYARVCAVMDGETTDWSSTLSFITSSRGVGTDSTGTNGYIPLHNYYRYSITQQIYTAEELGSSALISGIYFKKTADYDCVRDIDIYMVHTDKDSFSSTSDGVVVTANDKVFSGTVTFGTNEWTRISFDSLFAYNSTDNVILVVDDNTNGYKSTTSFQTVGSDNSTSLYSHNDSSDYDPTKASTYKGTLTAKCAAFFAVADTTYTVTADQSVQHGSVSFNASQSAPPV